MSINLYLEPLNWKITVTIIFKSLYLIDDDKKHIQIFL